MQALTDSLMVLITLFQNPKFVLLATAIYGSLFFGMWALGKFLQWDTHRRNSLKRENLTELLNRMSDADIDDLARQVEDQTNRRN